MRLPLSGDRMGQTLSRWLAIAPAGYRRMDLGPAELQIVKVETPQALQQALSAPDEGATYPRGALQVSWAGVPQSIDVKSSLAQPIKIGSGEIKLLGFWPDGGRFSSGGVLDFDNSLPAVLDPSISPLVPVLRDNFC